VEVECHPAGDELTPGSEDFTMRPTIAVDVDFGLRLYDALAGARGGAQPGENLFVSPFSIQAALAMVAAGALGETRCELTALLGVQEDVEEQHRRFAAWTTMFNADTAGHVELAVANALWARRGVRFKPAYRKAIAEFYDGACNEVDFQSMPDEAVQTINTWVAGKTRGKIDTLVTRELVAGDTGLVLTNAIYFNGTWETEFDPRDTLDEDWHGPAGVRKAQMMQQRRGFLYCETADYQALELPYQGQALSMLIVLPRQLDGLNALESTGAAARTYRQATDSLTHEKMVIVSLPRFRMASEFRLKSVLSGLGAARIFSEAADFGDMSSEPITFSEVVHKARIDVNEEGTEASAATAAVARKGGATQPRVFLADHPFLFFIRHRKSNAVLFCGRVMEPM
jgi:serpin B